MNPFLKSPVREICTPGSVGVRATNWVASLPGDLMPEAIWKFRVKNFGPLIVSIDCHGNNLYRNIKAQAKKNMEHVLAELGIKSDQ